MSSVGFGVRIGVGQHGEYVSLATEVAGRISATTLPPTQSCRGGLA